MSVKSEGLRLQDLPRIWGKILGLYFNFIFRFGEIHPDLPSGKLLADITTKAHEKPLEIRLPVSFSKFFNGRIALINAQLLKELGEPNFTFILIASFAVRAVQCFASWTFGWQLGLAAGLLQFVVAPFSLTGSFIRLLTNVSDCIFHYICNALVMLCLTWLITFSGADGLPKWQKLTISPTFAAAFFVIDFAANVFVHMRTSEEFGFSRMLWHVVYGTFNTKTYFVVVFGCLLGLEMDLLVIVLAGILTYAGKEKGLHKKCLELIGWPCFEICFYVEHRIGHMPVVYQHAHKMHHYLHDTTAFDAHVYGSGMNEEFFWILSEIIPCLLAPSVFFPYSLNLDTLYVSWTNKGAHARSAKDVTTETLGCFDEDNFHADHHTLHRANFGSSTGVLLDFYFGTQGTGTKGSAGLAYTKSIDKNDESKVVFRIERATGSNRAPQSGPAKLENEEEVVKDALVKSKADLKVISKKELSSHNAENSLWVAIHGGVFDLTTFQQRHPGGNQVILSNAGADTTTIFAEVGHSAVAKKVAKRFLIGLVEGEVTSGFVAEYLRHFD